MTTEPVGEHALRITVEAGDEYEAPEALGAALSQLKEAITDSVEDEVAGYAMADLGSIWSFSYETSSADSSKFTNNWGKDVPTLKGEVIPFGKGNAFKS